jgi:hypothetical protein
MGKQAGDNPELAAATRMAEKVNREVRLPL